jgi:cell fate (sporulation/competence/biofilm development) regulator YmcA (YheA/YmcA/DUF963 family)
VDDLDEIEIGKQLGKLIQGQEDILRKLEEMKEVQKGNQECLDDHENRLTKAEEKVKTLDKSNGALSKAVVTILLALLVAVIGHMIIGK